MNDEEVGKLWAEVQRAEGEWAHGFWREGVVKLIRKLVEERAGFRCITEAAAALSFGIKDWE